MEQLKVLLVDDEYLIRNLLKMRINWEEQGFTIVGEASNAHEALDIVDELQPDIIFTDVCMPFIDGIEFSGMVMEKYPDIKIVIVTGHDEFEFARKSIKLGIADFILKPIRAAELLSVVERLKIKIYEERTRNNELIKLREEFQNSLPYLREKFLNQWVMGLLADDEIAEKIRFFQLPFGDTPQQMQVAVLEISLPTAAPTEEQSILLGMECKSKAIAFFQDASQVVIFSDTKNQIIILSAETYENFIGDCELLKTNLINCYKCYVCIGIGQPHAHLLAMHMGYQEACRALNYKAFMGKNQVICYEDVVAVRGRQYHSNVGLLDKLQLCVSAGSSEEVLKTMDMIFDFTFASVPQFRLAAMDIITRCQYAAIEQQLENELENEKEMLTAIFTADNLPELKKSLEGVAVGLTKAIHRKNRAKEGDLISQVKDYLKSNMTDSELGLASTAAAFFVSPGHLGRLMKKKTGQTFVEYLTAIRMKEAELLLRDTDLKGYQVGERVGITDPHYFSILFKKNIGKSVNEFRSLSANPSASN